MCSNSRGWGGEKVHCLQAYCSHGVGVVLQAVTGRAGSQPSILEMGKLRL